VRPFLAKTNLADLEFLAGLLEAGTIRPVIDRTYPLAETAEAMRYVDAGHAHGKVVITIGGE
jgi:NADPH:quinone reductase-like Zn-dependent oxidoreductase